MTDLDKDDDDALLAAEYALGLLDGDEVRAVHRRAAEDAAFAALVTGWEMRFAEMASDLDEVEPSAAAKRTLMRDLFPEAPAPGFWQNLRLWQGIGVISLMLALAALGLAFLGQSPAAGPLYTAEIASDAGDFRVVALVDKSANEVILTRTEGAAPEGRILQVWAHGEGEPATSVGLWPEGETVRLPMPPEIAEVTGILTLGVSEEPPGGSPTGSPSGRVFGTVDIPSVSQVR